MKAKDKVLMLRPTATSYKVHNNGELAHWIVEIDGKVYGKQSRESWAWSAALRILSKPPTPGELIK